ncbi:MAG: hypothetical protein IIY23_05730, partial [Erysipelotrichaceae bacterium]|nr:hypothetical protein [Erysipelotrichaceae bacterium]
LWEKMNNWVYAGFDETYKKMGVSFDKIYYESQTYLKGKAKVEEGLAKGLFERHEDNSVWADLTNEGLDQKLLRQLNRQGPKKIAYISCNPETLKRDLRELEKNYRFSEIELFDQFGFTDHLEAVCILTHI